MGNHILAADEPFLGELSAVLHDANLTTDGLESKRDSGGDTENMFKRKGKSAVVQYRQVNGLRWLVTTQFQDRERQSVTNRTYRTVISGLLITLYVDKDTSTPLKPDVGAKVSRCSGSTRLWLSIFRTQRSNQAMQRTADRRTKKVEA